MILLDTRAAIWFLNDSGRLGERVRSSMRTDRRVCFSAATTFEITVKRMLGRLPVPADLHELLIGEGLEDLPVTSAHAAAVSVFPELVRHDPFDRLLLAQAYVEHATLVTGDRRLLGLGLDWVLDAAS